tara:strand:+ start:12736 stop:13209 length:474 start_codon:yes stop_codon:yes gene_type:complete
MFNIVLYQPEIPPNTGNIIRLCANTGAKLHLIKPLGFEITDKHLKRAGLDYHEFTNLKIYENYNEFINFLELDKEAKLYALTTKGSDLYQNIKYTINDYFIFGPETRGLPKEILDNLNKSNKIRIPMQKDSRSLNLSNTVAIVLFEALRQVEFPNLS